MRAKATIRFKFSSAKLLDTIIVSLLPEISKPCSGRTRLSLISENKFLVLTVEADDSVALRSALNTYLRWISSTVNVVDALRNVS